MFFADFGEEMKKNGSTDLKWVLCQVRQGII